MTELPISSDLIMTLTKTADIRSLERASIREIVHLVNLIEEETGVKFVRMEMGVPGLNTPSIAIEAEVAALRNSVASVYPDISGIESLKKETARFIKLFLNVDIDPQGCIPTV